MKLRTAFFFLTLFGVQAQTDKYTEIPGLPPPPTYSVRTAESIVVDGKLSEKGWANAQAITLMFPWEAQTGAKQRTTVRLLRDRTYLYVSYDCEDTDLTATYEKRDDPVYKDDCVEIFLRPDETTEHYIGLEMNARGVLFDYYFNYPEKNDYSLNLDGVLLKTTLRGTLNQTGDPDQGWSLELAIPWTSLSRLAKRFPPDAGDHWRAQINRWDGTEPHRRLSMWTRSGKKQPNPHNPERFGVLSFD
jgi:hypothetical protein